MNWQSAVCAVVPPKMLYDGPGRLEGAPQNVPGLGWVVGGRVPGHRDVGQVLQSKARVLEQAANRIGGKSWRVLKPISEPFFSDSARENAVSDKAGGRVGVEGVDA